MHSSHRTCAVFFALLAACADEPVGPSGEYVDFSPEVGQELCAGTVARLDRSIEDVAQFLEMPLPPGFRVEIHESRYPGCHGACYVPDEDAVYLGGTQQGGRLLPNAILRHEIGHAVFDRLLGHGSPFFNEGLAEALSPTGRITPVPGEPVGDMLHRPAIDLDYTAASLFVRFLIDSRGVERFKRLYRVVERGDSRDAVIARFAEVYGEDFAEIEAEYTAGPRRCQYQLDVCGAEEVEHAGSRWSVELAASCDDPDFFGDSGTFGAARAVMFDQAGKYRLHLAPVRLLDSFGDPALSLVTMIRCGDCSEQWTRILYSDEEVELAAGLYVFVFQPVGDSVMTLDAEYLGD